MTTRPCIYCGTDFQFQSTQGRPQAMCSNTCRRQARKDPTRICNHCQAQYDKATSQYIRFCSEACHIAATATCKACSNPPLPDGSLFCSAACLLEYSADPLCFACRQPHTPTPPFRRLPRFCSPACRATGTSSAFSRPQDAEYTTALTWGEPMPRRAVFRPFDAVSPELIPKLEPPEYHSMHINSVRWWTYHIRQAAAHWQNTDLMLAYMIHAAASGFPSQSDEPDCVPLDRCWPWIPTPVQHMAGAARLWNNMHLVKFGIKPSAILIKQDALAKQIARHLKQLQTNRKPTGTNLHEQEDRLAMKVDALNQAKQPPHPKQWIPHKLAAHAAAIKAFHLDAWLWEYLQDRHHWQALPYDGFTPPVDHSEAAIKLFRSTYDQRKQQRGVSS